MGFFSNINDKIASWGDTNSDSYNADGTLTDAAVAEIKNMVKSGQYDNHMDAIVSMSKSRKDIAKARALGIITQEESEAILAQKVAEREQAAKEEYDNRIGHFDIDEYL
jgi:hypothetical protein